MSDSENSDYYPSTSTTKKLPTRRAKTAKKAIIDIDSDISEDFSAKKSIFDVDSDNSEEFPVIEEEASSKTAKKSIFD
ncbi:25035_t:CDS:2, partial [Gigaspora margarita]